MARKVKYKALRTETFTRGENVYALVAGEVYDLPDDLVEIIGGDYGAIEEEDDANP